MMTFLAWHFVRRLIFWNNNLKLFFFSIQIILLTSEISTDSNLNRHFFHRLTPSPILRNIPGTLLIQGQHTARKALLSNWNSRILQHNPWVQYQLSSDKLQLSKNSQHKWRKFQSYLNLIQPNKTDPHQILHPRRNWWKRPFFSTYNLDQHNRPTAL